MATVSIEVPSFDPVLVREVEKDLADTLGTEGVIYAHRTFDDFTVLYAYVGELVADDVRRLADPMVSSRLRGHGRTRSRVGHLRGHALGGIAADALRLHVRYHPVRGRRRGNGHRPW